MAAVHAVIDLGFGDAGKGSIVDFLVRHFGAAHVVRWHGGAQAGHRVVTPDGRAHVFAQFGAGTFAGASTHLAAGFVLDPPALLHEARALAQLGRPDALGRLTIDPDALVIPPHARAANRLRERARGLAAHGSCGIGFGETVRLSLETALGPSALAIRAGDFYRPAGLPRRLRQIREFLREELGELLDAFGTPEDRRTFDTDETSEEWIASLAPLLSHSLLAGAGELERRLSARGHVVFEGAQGVLLDEWMGFHPHTTWSTCTSHGLDALLDALGHAGPRHRYGLTRSYATRHGQGPMPTHVPALSRLPEAANGDEGFQGRFRRGWLDLTLLRYALEVSPVDSLVVTHLDRVDADFRVATALEGPSMPGLVEQGRLIPSAELEDLDHQAALATWLNGSRPVLAPAPSVDRLLAHVRTLGLPVSLTSHGPTAGHKRQTSTSPPRT